MGHKRRLESSDSESILNAAAARGEPLPRRNRTDTACHRQQSPYLDQIDWATVVAFRSRAGRHATRHGERLLRLNTSHETRREQNPGKTDDEGSSRCVMVTDHTALAVIQLQNRRVEDIVFHIERAISATHILEDPNAERYAGQRIVVVQREGIVAVVGFMKISLCSGGERPAGRFKSSNIAWFTACSRGARNARPSTQGAVRPGFS